MAEPGQPFDKPLDLPVRFRISTSDEEAEISEPARGVIRVLTLQGLTMETSQIEIDGLHVSFNKGPDQKNRVYLFWNLPSGGSVKAVAETVWYERKSTASPQYLVRLRFLEISEEDRDALRAFFSPP